MGFRRFRILAVILVLALVAAACGDDDGADATTTTVADTTTTTRAPTTTSGDMGDMGDTPMGQEATQTGSAELRALLTAQLQEHVYLAGIAVFNAVNNPDAFEASAATLDRNSVELSESIGSVYGDDAAEAFLELWRTHIGFFVDYTNARAAGDAEGQQEAMEALRGYREDFGAFLESANPNLTKEAVVEELEPHVTTVFAAIDAVVDGDPEAFDRLKDAADVMPETAAVLAGAIAAQFEMEG